MRRTNRFIGVVAVGALLLAACSSDDDDPVASGDNTATTEADDDTATTEADDDDGLSDDDDADNDGRSTNTPSTVDVDLRLRSVNLRVDSLDDDEEEFAEFCFGASIQEVMSDDGFTLQGFDADEEVTSTSATLLEDDTTCVLASFEEGTDLTTFTIGTTESGVVAVADGDVNIQDSIALGGSTGFEGATSAPELVDGGADFTLDRVSYVFNNELDEDASPDASQFGFYTRNGDVTFGESVVSIEDRTVEIQFSDEAPLEDGRRPFVLQGAVTSRSGQESIISTLAGETTVPDLVAVEGDDGAPTQFDFLFDETVTDPDAGLFMVYTSDGTAYTGDKATTAGENMIRVTFSAVEDFADQIAVAAVSADAVSSIDSGSPGNTVGSSVLDREAVRQGATSAPDLVGAQLDEETGQVRFVFDERVDEDAEPDASMFLIITDSGAVIEGQSFVEVLDNAVIIRFDENDAEAGAAASVNPGAIADEQGNESPRNTVDIG